MPKIDPNKYIQQTADYHDHINKYNLSRGQQTEDIAVLLTYVDELPTNAVYVESGICDGSAILTVALQRPDIQCYGIDIQIPNRGNFQKVLDDLGIKNITFIHGDSTDVCKTWDKEIDLLFIDTGYHLFPQIFYDFAGWLPHVKTGAPILWHDYENNEDGKTGFEVGQAFKVFKGHPKYNTYIPVLEDNIHSSIAIIIKP